ncbi:MAG: mycofactocin biosynthesis chaperone MftB [Candidatus Competibacteraceae bacterium]|nr:mycofactocin biosynthesis chaperone MftB [Candidatus Competibacteraceae bacterium]
MNATVELVACYRLAPGVAIRPERFGGLVYRYDNRRLYFLHSHQAVEFINCLDGHRSLQEILDEFLVSRDMPPSASETLVKAVGQLERMGLLTTGGAVTQGVGYSRG